MVKHEPSALISVNQFTIIVIHNHYEPVSSLNSHEQPVSHNNLLSPWWTIRVQREAPGPPFWVSLSLPRWSPRRDPERARTKSCWLHIPWSWPALTSWRWLEPMVVINVRLVVDPAVFIKPSKGHCQFHSWWFTIHRSLLILLVNHLLWNSKNTYSHSGLLTSESFIPSWVVSWLERCLLSACHRSKVILHSPIINQCRFEHERGIVGGTFCPRLEDPAHSGL